MNCGAQTECISRTNGCFSKVQLRCVCECVYECEALAVLFSENVLVRSVWPGSYHDKQSSRCELAVF